MKRIITILLTLITMASTISAQTLSDRQKHLATIAALEAQGDLVRLEPAIKEALDSEVTINEIKEVFSQLYAYTGFPRSLNALGVLSSVLENSNGKWTEGKPWVRPAIWNDAKKSLEAGTEVQTKLFGPVKNEFSPQNDYYLKAHLFGDIFAGDQLTPADREIVTVAALSALKGVAPQLAAHKAAAVNIGNSQQVVDELCAFLSENGLSFSDGAPEINWQKGNPNDAYAQYFTGNSYLAPIQPKNLAAGDRTIQGYSNVTFEPGCRNNWHIHHGAHQILICVSGEGIYQEWGKPAIHLHAGDIIDIPEGVKHWHGATKNSWFQHLASHVHVSDPESNEWLEPVSDEQYASANHAAVRIHTKKDMIVRISEIEVYPEHLQEYLEFAHNVGVTSVKEEPGVICIYPMQQLRNNCQIRILEIYASQEAYQHHIKTPHFQTYKQGTLHMVKSLDLVDMSQMAPEALSLIFSKSDIPSFQEIVSSRYSCKKFSNEQISKHQLDAILEAGRLAPTAKNLQEQHIYVVQSAEVLAKIDANTPCRYGAPTCLVVAYDKNNVFTYPGGKRDSGIEDASIVATHMILAAESVGVNSCWINYFDPEKLAADLGLPENEEILMILDLGYAAEGTGPLKTHFSRKPIEEKVTYL